MTAAVGRLAGYPAWQQPLTVAIGATDGRHRMAVDRHRCATAMAAVAAAVTAAADTETDRLLAVAVDRRLPTAAAVIAAAAG